MISPILEMRKLKEVICQYRSVRKVWSWDWDAGRQKPDCRAGAFNRPLPSVSVQLPLLLMQMDSILGIQRGVILHQD